MMRKHFRIAMSPTRELVAAPSFLHLVARGAALGLFWGGSASIVLTIWGVW